MSKSDNATGAEMDVQMSSFADSKQRALDGGDSLAGVVDNAFSLEGGRSSASSLDIINGLGGSLTAAGSGGKRAIKEAGDEQAQADVNNIIGRGANAAGSQQGQQAARPPSPRADTGETTLGPGLTLASKKGGQKAQRRRCSRRSL